MIAYFQKYLKKRLLIGLDINRNNFNQSKLFELQKNLLKINFENSYLDNFILKDMSKDDLNIFVNQTFSRLIRENFYKSFNFFSSYKLSLIYPFLPLNILKEIEEFGIQVNYKFSILLQKAFFIFKIFEMILIVFIFVLKIRINIDTNKTNPKSSIFIYEINNLFINKKKFIFKKKLLEKYMNNINYFYSNRGLNIYNIKNIEFFPKISVADYLKFLKSSFNIIFNFNKYNFFIKCKGNELILSNYFKYSQMNSLFFNILFSESSRINRPLWTYFLEKKNWNIIYYNYSTNQSNVIKFYPNNYKPGEFKYFSFRKCIFSNKELYDYHIKKSESITHEEFIYDEKLFIYNDIFKKNSLSRMVISIFDTVIYDESIYGNIPRPYWYYEKKNVVNFYKDIFEKLNFYKDLIIIVKRKSKELNSKEIIKRCFSGNLKNRIFFVDNVNTIKLVTFSDLVITIPFSTPSMIAEINRTRAITYDSSNNLSNYYEDRSIKFANNKNTLLHEIDNFIKNN